MKKERRKEKGMPLCSAWRHNGSGHIFPGQMFNNRQQAITKTNVVKPETFIKTQWILVIHLAQDDCFFYAFPLTFNFLVIWSDVYVFYLDIVIHWSISPQAPGSPWNHTLPFQKVKEQCSSAICIPLCSIFLRIQYLNTLKMFVQICCSVKP